MEFSTLNGYKVKDKKAIRFYDTVDDMINDSTLKEGMHAKTKGYYSVNDGGASEYHITATESETDYQEELENGLYATLIIENNTVTPEMFGAYGDGVHDDTSYFTTIINKFDNKNPVINIQGKIGKKYVIEDLVTHFISIKDCSFFPKTEYVSNGINMHSRTTLYHCVFSGFYKAIFCEGSYNVYSEINNCTFQYNRFGVYFIGTASGSTDYSINDMRILNSYFVKNGTNVDDMSGESTPDNGYGIYIDNAFHNVLIQGNLIEYNSFTGIYLNQTTSVHNNACTIIGNYFEGNRDSAIYMNGSVNVRHMIMITGNFYTIGEQNIRNTKYINVNHIFRSAYVMEDINPITINPRTATGITNNEDHTMTYSYGCSQYQQFTPVHNFNRIYHVRFINTLNSSLVLYVGPTGSQQTFTLTNGYNEITIVDINPSNWYFGRALDEGETIKVLGSWS